MNMDKFTFRDKPKGTNIAWVCERWYSKGIDLALQLAGMLPDGYTIHALGTWNDIYPWDMKYYDRVIKELGDKFTITEQVENVNAWLEDKDYILSTSKKETFGYSIAEGMAKGLKPVIHNFYGCEAVWDKYTWNYLPKAVKMITEDDFKPEQYRQFLYDKGYNLGAMMNKFNNIIKEGGKHGQ